jgi:hypothetical protein
MTSRLEALEIAQASLSTWEFNHEGDTLILLESETEETPYAWVVYWTSKLWYQTRKSKYALAGAGPFIISKQTGQVTQYSSAYATESALEKYEEERQLYGIRVTTDLTDVRARLLLKTLLPMSNQELLRVAREPTNLVARGSRRRLKQIQNQMLAQGLATEMVACF